MINKKNITIPIPPIHWVSARHNNKLLGKPSTDPYNVNPVVVKPEIDSKYALIKLYLNEGKYEIGEESYCCGINISGIGIPIKRISEIDWIEVPQPLLPML